MKQPEDTKTMDLALAEKRGRGRPPKADALSGAERAKRFRDAHREGVRKALTVELVTENNKTVTQKEFEELRRTEQSRSLALASAHAEIRILIAKLAEKDVEIAALRSRRKSMK